GRVAGAFSIAAIDSRMAPARQAEIGALLGEEAARMEAALADLFRTRRAGAPATESASAPAARRRA
ncbi:hypothetical protein ABTN17_20745, partial [Acinetobacter baumannii]